MKTLEEAIERFSGCCTFITNQKETCEQLAAWLRELQERRKADSCEGCVNESKPNLLVCYTCRRHHHYADMYRPKGRTE